MRRVILIVDDSAVNRMAFRNMLDNDYVILEAGTGPEALDVLFGNPEGITAVLLDVLMPDMDGFEVLMHIRDDERTRWLPVIIMTANADADAENMALAFGATDFVAKTDHQYAIKRRIENAINLHEMSEQIKSRYEHEIRLRHEMVHDSENYFQINLTTGMIEEYFSKSEGARTIDTPTPTDQAFRDEVLQYVAAEDRKAVADSLFIEGLWKCYRDGKSTTSIDYRHIMPGGNVRWLRAMATIIKKPNTDEVIAFIHSRDVDREKKDQLALDSIIGEEIESTCIVDVQTGLAHLLKINDGLDNLREGEEFPYDVISQRVRETVFEEDQPRCEPISSLDNLIKALEHQPAVICTYRSRDKSSRVLRKSSRAFYLDDSRESIVMSRRDITAQHDTEARNEAIRKSEELLRLVVEHSARAIYRYDMATREAVSVAPAASEALGLPSRITNMPEGMIEEGTIFAEDAKYVRQLFATARSNGAPDSMRFRVRDKSGGIRWLDVKYTFIGNDGVPIAAVISCLDVTELHERELAYARYRQTTDMALNKDVSYFETDITADLVERQGGNMLPDGLNAVGSSYTQTLEYIINHHLSDENRAEGRVFLSRDHLLTLYADGKRDVSKDWQVTFSDNSPHWMRSTIQMVADPFTGHIKVFTLIKDVTQEKRDSLAMQMRAELDGMTGLYNKTTAEARINGRLARADGMPCWLLVADLDHLKAINDSLGHDQGDMAIKHMAQTLRAQFRKSDIIGRIGGDEFVVFIDGDFSEARLRSTLASFSHKLAAVRGEETAIRPLHASIGVAIGACGKETYETLFKKADRALYQVKRNGKGYYAIYTPDMDDEAYQHRQREADKWQAISFDGNYMEQLLSAISTIYPMVICVNLTHNCYHMMRYESCWTKSFKDSGVYDDLIAAAAQTFHPEDRQSFVAAFSRESLISAHELAQPAVGFTGRQMGDDGVYRIIHSDAIFVSANNNDEVWNITLVRQAEQM